MATRAERMTVANFMVTDDLCLGPNEILDAIRLVGGLLQKYVMINAMRKV